MGRSTRYLIVAAIILVGVVTAIFMWPRQSPPSAEPPAATVATPTEAAAAQAESPLDQPESPLGQPESPLTIDPRDIVANPAVAFDRDAVVNLVGATTAPEPQPGQAALSAVLWSRANNQTIYGTNVYLTPADIVDGKPAPPVIYLGPKPEENGDVTGQTNMEGQLLIDNIPPGDYYLVVWSVYDWPAAFTSPDDNLPVLISVGDGDKLDLGLLYVDWP